jgi:hypothetical protein
MKNFIDGYVREIPQNVEATRSIPFIISSSKRDGHKTVVNMNNWNLDRYNRNPIVGYMHDVYGDVMMCQTDNPDTVIGYSSISFEGGLMLGMATFETNDINPLAEKIFKKVRFGTLRGASVGFMEEGAGKYGEGDEKRGAANETYYFEGQELLEWSVVKIGSNPEAVKKFMGDKVERFLEALSINSKTPLSEIYKMSAKDIIDLSQGRSLIKEDQLEQGIDERQRNKIGQRIFIMKHELKTK